MRRQIGDWADRLVWGLLLRLPGVIIEYPERILLKASLSTLGIAWLLVPPESSALSGFAPTLLRYMWCTYLFIGGIATIYGTVKEKPTIEMLGLFATAMGCFLVAGTAFLLVPRGIVSAVVFTFVGIATTIRLLVSYGARGTLRRLNEDYVE